jgi:N6-L-threonylcarbamoyladenine synthase
VGANQHLRQVLDELAQKRANKVYYPAPQYCTDNGAMIAYAGAMRLLVGQHDEEVFDVLPRWSLEDLTPLP